MDKNNNEAQEQTSENFEDYLTAFQVHYQQVSKVERCMSEYSKRIHEARDSLIKMSDELKKFYEMKWKNSETFTTALEDQAILWKLYEANLRAIHDGMGAYKQQLDKVQEHLDLRHSKLVEMKSAKRALQNAIRIKQSWELVKAAGAKFSSREKSYKQTHDRLMKAYPRILQSRFDFIVNYIAKLFKATEEFSKENSEVQAAARESVEQLLQESNSEHEILSPIGNSQEERTELGPRRKSRTINATANKSKTSHLNSAKF